MKKIVLALTAVMAVNFASAQSDSTVTPRKKNLFVTESPKFSLSTLKEWMAYHDVFQNLDVSVTAGTTGIGIDVASRVHEMVQLRLGYEFMPRFNKSIYFPVEVGGQPAVAYDANGNRVETTFDRLSSMLHDLTGFKVDEEVEMVGKPTVNNFKFLVDVFPFADKHWHVTGGFYWGPSQFAYAENSTTAMTSLLAVSMYNQIYEKCVKDEPIISIKGDGTAQNPGMNVFLTEAYRQKIVNYGRMGFHVGDDKQTGEAYVMEPDAASGMVKVRAKSNSFKPYLGFGYGGRLLNDRDDWQVSFDAGMMFWGGKPDLYTHDGTNLTKDVKNITGKVGDWVDLMGGIKVYPVLSVRFTKTIF